jgi:hypothetical protein
MNQKLSDWASVAEILGAAAIVVSLIFVGFQVRQNTDYLRRGENNATMEQASAVRLLTIDMAEILVKSRNGVDALSDVEMLKISTYFREVMWQSFQIFDRERGGYLDEGSWAQSSATTGLLADPIARSWWEQAKQTFPPDFVDAVEERLGFPP